MAGRVELLILLLATLVVGIAILVGALDDEVDRQFAEDGFVTRVSALSLLGLSALSFVIFHTRRGGAPIRQLASPYNIWLIAAAGFFYLAFDEEFQVHERADDWIHSLLSIEETPVTDSIDDALVGLYALLAICATVVWRRELLASHRTQRFFILSFALIILMVGLDVLTNRRSTLDVFFKADLASSLHTALSTMEDSLKIYAEGTIALGLLAAFHRARIPDSGASVVGSGKG